MTPVLKLDWRPSTLIVHAKKRADIEELKRVYSISEQSSTTLSADYYALIPKAAEVPVPKLLDVVSVSDITGELVRQENIQDFLDSGKVYAFLKQKKIKVLQDDYSYIKNQRLYTAFNLIETKWRILVLSNDKLVQLINSGSFNPQEYRGDALDHKVAQYHLSEFYEKFLLAPASDEFMIQEWGKSNKSDEDLIRVKNLRRLNELKFPLNEAELHQLRKARNQCMHFRVTTLEEYIQTIELVNRYLKETEMRQFVNDIAKAMEPLLEALKQLPQLVSQQLSSEQALKTIADLARHYNQFKLP